MTRSPSGPVLQSAAALLRPLRPADADALVEALANETVGRFMHAPPATPAAFGRYVAWAAREQRAGRHLALAVVPHGSTRAVGLFQVRRHGPTWDIAEWGFAMGAPCWGTGLFAPAATAVVAYAIDTLGVRRLEARAAVANGRGNGALAKLGAVCEAVLYDAFERHGHTWDQRLWTILATQWERHAGSCTGAPDPRLRLSPTGAK